MHLISMEIFSFTGSKFKYSSCFRLPVLIYLMQSVDRKVLKQRCSYPWPEVRQGCENGAGNDPLAPNFLWPYEEVIKGLHARKTEKSVKEDVPEASSFLPVSFCLHNTLFIFWDLTCLACWLIQLLKDRGWTVCRPATTTCMFTADKRMD